MLAALEGVRVLDLTQTLAGPFGAMMLGDLGAEVLKIEPPGKRQIVDVGTFVNDESVHFLANNRNKKSIILDLRSPQGRDVFYDLVKCSDVVFDNYRVGVLKKLHVDYDSINAFNKRIISCSITGYGSSGPYKDRPAYDLVIQGISDGMSITGDPPPARAGIPLADLSGGLLAVQGILAALYAREKSGLGQRVEVSLLAGQIAMLTYCVPNYFASGGAVGILGIGQGSNPVYRMYDTKKGYITVAIPPSANGKFWEGFCRALGHEELATDKKFHTYNQRRKNQQELVSILENIFRTRPASEWMAHLIREGVPCGPVNSIEQALCDPQVLHQNMVVPLDCVGGGQVKVAANPVYMSASEQPYRPAPSFGQHTEEILSGLLHYSSERIAALRHDNVIQP